MCRERELEDHDMEQRLKNKSIKLPNTVKICDSNGNASVDNNGNGAFDFNGNGKI